MKKIKILVASVLCCAMGYTGYTAYEKMTMSEAKKSMIANVEALTSEETTYLKGRWRTVGCKPNVRTISDNAEMTFSSVEEIVFTDDLTSFIDTMLYIVPEMILPNPISKMLIDETGEIYMLGFRGDLTTCTSEGKKFRHFTNRGKAQNEYIKINDIALRKQPKELLLLDEHKVISFRIADTLSFKTFYTPAGIPFDAIAPSGEENCWLFSAFPEHGEDINKRKDYMLKLVNQNGEILKESIRREDVTFSMMNITQSANNTYYLKPQNANQIFYALEQDSIVPRYKIDFGDQNIPARYFFDVANSDIATYMHAAYFKQPSFAHETQKHFYFKCAGPNAIEYNFLFDKKNPQNKFGWINADQTSNLYIIGADENYFYIVFDQFQFEQYQNNKEKKNNPLYRYIMQSLDAESAFKHSEEIIIKIAFR